MCNIKRKVAARAKERASISFFIFVIFFGVFGMIVLTELFMLERTSSSGRGGGALRAKLANDMETWVESRQDRVRPAPAANPVPVATEPLDATWQPVETISSLHTKFKFFVYSAYIERRTIPAIRIIAATKTRGTGQFWCQVSLADNRTLSIIAHVKAIRENWHLQYSACFVLCPLKDTGITVDDLVGASVSIVPHKLHAPTNMLKVIDTEKQGELEDKLVMCLKPIHFSYSRSLWLIEWMELQILLGVSHFIMYEESVSSTVRCVLDHYIQRGLLTLLPWKLGIKSIVEIRNQGQFAAFNDCLYRSMAAAGWLITLDMDEVVLPRRERTLTTMLSIFRSSRPSDQKPPSAFLFRNAFFYLRWDDDKTTADSPLVTMRKTRRWAVPHAVKNRSKFAVKPSEAVELGNHFVWEFAPGRSAFAVPMNRALLHHYRMECEYGGHECVKVPSVIDRTAHRWSDDLEIQVNRTHKALEVQCGLPPRNSPHAKHRNSTDKSDKKTV